MLRKRVAVLGCAALAAPGISGSGGVAGGGTVACRGGRG